MSETTDDLEAYGDPEYFRGYDRWDQLAVDKVWTDGSGREWQVEDMSDTHLFNLLWMLKRIGLANAWNITGNPEEDGAPFYPDGFDPHWTEGFDEQEWEGIKILLIEYALRRFDNACQGTDDSETLGLDKGSERRRLSPDRRPREPAVLDGNSLRARGADALARLQGNARLWRARRARKDHP